MAHFDGNVDNLIECEEYWDLQQHRPATSNWIDLLFLIELHHSLLHRHTVAAVLGFELFHLRLKTLHLRHRSILLAGEWEEDKLYNNGCEKDRNTKVTK